MIGNGETAGVFQLESQGRTNFMKDLMPDCLEDVIAVYHCTDLGLWIRFQDIFVTRTIRRSIISDP